MSEHRVPVSIGVRPAPNQEVEVRHIVMEEPFLPNGEWWLECEDGQWYAVAESND